eukprot:scaffold1770_cov375-Prasinococcus_capsulatus_cf.AAC.10
MSVLVAARQHGARMNACSEYSTSCTSRELKYAAHFRVHATASPLAACKAGHPSPLRSLSPDEPRPRPQLDGGLGERRKARGPRARVLRALVEPTRRPPPLAQLPSA